MTASAEVKNKIRSWAPDEYETRARQQAEETALAQGVHGVAIMPDAHVGIGACVGTVVATEGTILPTAVGVDIGCGMSAAKLDCTADRLPDTLEGVLAGFGAAVPENSFDDDRRHTQTPARKRALKWLRTNRAPSGLADMDRAAAQIGTLGSGNHFLEMSVDDHGDVWLVIHSGSRGAGNFLARKHIRTAQDLDIAAKHRDLAALVEGTPEFAAYIADMLWAQDYARENRDAALEDAVRSFRETTGLDTEVVDMVRCHHNYTEPEVHEGRKMWVTRKGAIRAQQGDRGVIPGSMGTATYIVEGLGCERSFNSASHGAGRVLSRRKAKEQVSMDEFEASMAGRVWQQSKAASLLDEAPAAYKDIEQVMERQRDLCKPVLRLEALVNYKGTR